MATTFDPTAKKKEKTNLVSLKKQRESKSLKQLLAKGQGEYFCPPSSKKEELSPQGIGERKLQLTLWWPCAAV